MHTKTNLGPEAYSNFNTSYLCSVGCYGCIPIRCAQCHGILTKLSHVWTGVIYSIRRYYQFKTPLDTQTPSDEYVDRQKTSCETLTGWNGIILMLQCSQINDTTTNQSTSTYTPWANGCGTTSPDFKVANLPNGLVFTRGRFGLCNDLVISLTSYNNDRSPSL
jgi:hypothetical protein